MKRAVILAGGRGTRLAPLTMVFPKPLVPLGETPILEIVLRQLKRAGFESATIAVGHLSQLIEAYFGDGADLGISIDYAREQQPLGTAGPLAGLAGLDEAFLVMNGDVLSTLDYSTFLAEHVASGAALSIAAHRRVDVVDFGIIVECDGRVTDYVEKPETEYLVSMGVYAFSPHALRFVRQGERLDFPELVLRLVSEGEYVRSVPFDGRWLDIGRQDDFEKAQTEFAQHRSAYLGEGE